MENLLKGTDVAKRLQISRSFAYWLMKNEIPTVRLGRLLRVRISDLEEYISRNMDLPFDLSTVLVSSKRTPHGHIPDPDNKLTA